MEKLVLIAAALEIIENNLTKEITTDGIARALYCSRSSLEKLFKYVTLSSIKDYTIRRRMSKAARELVENPELSLLDLAVKYGYGSNEAFSRAFRSVWHTNLHSADALASEESGKEISNGISFLGSGLL